MMHKKKNGFTIVEVMMALVILAILTTAVAFAFDASVKNYQANQGTYQTVNTARAALLRITNDLRTAQAVALTHVQEAPKSQYRVLGLDPDTDYYDPDTFQCSILRKDGTDITYLFNAAENPPYKANTLYYIDNNTGQPYVLCKNVTSTTFNRSECVVDRGGTLGNIQCIRDVRIVMTLTDDAGKVSQTLAAAVLVRKNL